MPLKFKNQLKGDRLILKRTMPVFKMAEYIFKTIDENRTHLDTLTKEHNEIILIK